MQILVSPGNGDEDRKTHKTAHHCRRCMPGNDRISKGSHRMLTALYRQKTVHFHTQFGRNTDHID
jgi:hypothetical protein